MGAPIWRWPAKQPPARPVPAAARPRTLAMRMPRPPTPESRVLSKVDVSQLRYSVGHGAATTRTRRPTGRGVRSRTRTLLLDAAVRVFSRKGAGAAAIHDIAAEAGVSNGTFYNYFRTRAEILEAASFRLAERLRPRDRRELCRRRRHRRACRHRLPPLRPAGHARPHVGSGPRARMGKLAGAEGADVRGIVVQAGVGESR